MNNFLKKYGGLILLGWGGCFIYRVAYMRYVMYEPLQNALNVNHTEFGNMASVLGISALLSYWPGGWLADRVSPRYLLTFSYISTGLIGIYFATFPSYAICLIIHAALGVSITLTFWAAMLRATKDMAPKEELGRFYGLLESGKGLITVATVSIFAWIFTLYSDPDEGIKLLMNLGNAGCLLTGVLTWFFFKDPAKLSPNPSLTKDIVMVLKSPWIWCVALIVFSSYSAMVLGSYMTPYMTSVVGVSPATISFLAGIWIYGSQMVAPSISGIVSDKMGGASRPLVMIIIFIGILAIFTLSVILPPSPDIWILLVMVAVSMYMGIYALRGVYYAVLDDLRVPASIIGASIGFASMVGFAPDAFLYTVAGNILDAYPGVTGYKICFSLAGAMSLIGVTISILVLRKTKAILRAESVA